MVSWERTHTQDPRCKNLADRHYSREGKEGRGFGRPGFSLVLLAKDPDGRGVLFVWWRPKWESGLPQAQRFDELKAIECTLFRNESKWRSSELIDSATRELFTWEHYRDVDLVDGLVTCVNSGKTSGRRSKKKLPGHCYRVLGWTEFGHLPSRNADVWLQFKPQVHDKNLSRWLEDRKTFGWSTKGVTSATRSMFTQMAGKKFTGLTVVRYESIRARPDGLGGVPIWVCNCACGNQVNVRQDFLFNGGAKTCGKCKGGRAAALSEEVLRNIALAVEFEGSIGAYDISPVIVISVRDYSADLLQAVQSKTGLGRINYSLKQKVVQWRVVGEEAVELCRQLVPYLITKRRQAEVVTGYPLGVRSERVSPEKRAQREKCIAETKQLNRRGPREAHSSWECNAADWRVAIAEMTPRERAALLAMAIDFEGNIGVHEHAHPPSQDGVRHSTLVGVSQVVQRAVLLDLARLLAGGVGIVRPCSAPTNPLWSQMCQWRVEVLEDVKRICRETAPFLCGKRPIAELVIRFPEWPHRPLPVPAVDFELRRQLALESKRLNAVLDSEYLSGAGAA